MFKGRVHPGYLLSVLPVVLVLEAAFYYVFVVNFSQEGTYLGPRGWIVFLIVFTIPLLAFIHPWLVMKSTEIALTDQRVLLKTGIFTIATSELALKQVETIEIEQSICCEWNRRKDDSCPWNCKTIFFSKVSCKRLKHGLVDRF